jgi:hypothetical protein
MPTYTGIDRIIVELRAEKTNLTAQINKLDGALRELGQTSLGSSASLSISNGSRRGSHMSAAARRKISLAQKARWARVKAGKKG